MRGYATIQLFDAKTKKEVKKIEEHNLVTNFFKEFHKQVFNLNEIPYENDIFKIAAKHANINDLLGDGGILLFEEPKEENPNLITTAKTPFAYAGSNYGNTDPTRGSLNTNETANITKDGKVIGKKFVWDFPTSCANGTFQNICLTNSHFGNKIKYGLTFRTGPYVATSSVNLNGCKILNFDIEKGDFKRKLSLGLNGEVYFSDNNKIKIFVNCNDNVVGNSMSLNYYNLTPDDVITLNGYEKLCKVIDDHIDNIYITCGYNLETDKWNIIKINKDTKEISSTIELTNIEVTTKQRVAEIYDFGITKGIIYYNPPINKGSNRTYISRYDFINQEQLNDVAFYSASTTSTNTQYQHTFLSTIKEEEDYYCTASYQFASNSSSYAGAALFYGTETIYINKSSENESRNRLISNIGTLPFGITSTGTSSYGCGVGFAPLYTINNLENPITKTEGNTMKIAYTLMWDS